jgi:hypothetical protein
MTTYNMAFTAPLSFRPNSLSKPSLAKLRELRKCLVRYLKENQSGFNTLGVISIKTIKEIKIKANKYRKKVFLEDGSIVINHNQTVKKYFLQKICLTYL